MTAAPELQARAARDGLGWTCFALHIAIVAFSALGWLAPWRWVLIVYLVYVPFIVVQWQLNRGSCILNNIESLIRTGRWRDPGNAEEGAFLLRLVEDVFGFHPTHRQMNVFIYAIVSIFWGLAAGNLWLRQAAS